jgi:hypothetical protein
MREWKKVFANHIFNEGLISRTYKERLQEKEQPDCFLTDKGVEQTFLLRRCLRDITNPQGAQIQTTVWHIACSLAWLTKTKQKIKGWQGGGEIVTLCTDDGNVRYEATLENGIAISR